MPVWCIESTQIFAKLKRILFIAIKQNLQQKLIITDSGVENGEIESHRTPSNIADNEIVTIRDGSETIALLGSYHGYSVSAAVVDKELVAVFGIIPHEVVETCLQMLI